MLRRQSRISCAQEGCINLIPDAPCFKKTLYSSYLCTLEHFALASQAVSLQSVRLKQRHLIRSTALESCEYSPREHEKGRRDAITQHTHMQLGIFLDKCSIGTFTDVEHTSLRLKIYEKGAQVISSHTTMAPNKIQ